MLANEADLNSLSTEDLLVFRIVGGCSDDLLRKKFLRLSNPSLSDIAKEAATWEGVRRSLVTYDMSPSLNKQSQDTAQKKPRCPNCSSNQHPDGKACPAKDKTFNICGKTGHFGRTRQGKLICRLAPADTTKVPVVVARAVARLSPRLLLLLRIKRPSLLCSFHNETSRALPGTLRAPRPHHSPSLLW